MKKIIMISLLVTSHFSTLPVLAGGIHCKECPAESTICLPKAGCKDYLEQIEAIEHGYCPSNSVLDCKGKILNSTCEIESEMGTCHLTPTKAGSFCMCYRK